MRRPCRLSGVGKDGKSGSGQAIFPDISHNARMLTPEKQPKDFDLHKGANLSERKQNFAKSTQRRKVGNRTFPTGYEAGADLAGDLSERRALSVSFVRAAYGAIGVNQNPGDSAPRAPSFQTFFTLNFTLTRKI
ncbi:hypothetical protein DSY1585 [Desulfitobacterium hafniense Y51]|uniref:Uncharacterized protein n=1 Tax=Desulfitobacterium hafniense (strain Y51) TaxID=138119 RepID=Q24X68_DESHY|nr:hypothetical protein DSY1585 [Desulfitobacterium hafniense Y51]